MKTLYKIGTLTILSFASTPGSSVFGGDGKSPSLETATIVLGGGCFWCMEAVYERIEGVIDVISGYAGGSVKNPTYEQVSTGQTGHAEVVQITYHKAKVSLEKILDIFWKSHDPTTLNRQGADVGHQYRSIILYKTDTEKKIAEASKNKAQQYIQVPIVTEIVPLTGFFQAEEYHQDYYRKNPYAGYCTFVIRPKLEKLGL
ncbi:MAG TPA: peptide-methionine (S)-S-oxide reductase MsrA [Spirochaetales bacterium]|nr:peptide-methionine (S)-S-oxide reductase MsrA [Spirochaetales bacterium]